MKVYADLEIGLHQRSGNTYTVEARFSPVASEADIRIGEQESIEIQIDLDALQRYAHNFDMVSYGRSLTDALFSPVQLKEFFARAVSDAGSDPLRIRQILVNFSSFLVTRAPDPNIIVQNAIEFSWNLRLWHSYADG